MSSEYFKLRNGVLTKYPSKEKLPICLKKCSTLSDIRIYFQGQATDYKTRRSLINNEFNNSLSFDVISDFEKSVDEIEENDLDILPNEVKRKGKEMANMYFILYCIENSLRIFIEKVFISRLGGDYFAKIQIPTSASKSIQAKKESEQKKKWISIRGNSELFYLDFKDLSALISNNWEYFKDYFPNEQWIKGKIEELGDCRNLIAHNSYIGEHEKNVINVYHRSIVKQICNQTNIDKNIKTI